VLQGQLHDIQLVTAKPDLLTLTGYEVSRSNGGKSVQLPASWVLRPVTDAQLQRRIGRCERERMTAFLQQQRVNRRTP
jgi:hypothetical protein